MLVSTLLNYESFSWQWQIPPVFMDLTVLLQGISTLLTSSSSECVSYGFRGGSHSARRVTDPRLLGEEVR